MIAIVIATGFMSGSMIFVKIVQCPAPSMSADSSRYFGIDW
jgi:hypothetical protein